MSGSNASSVSTSSEVEPPPQTPIPASPPQSSLDDKLEDVRDAIFNTTPFCRGDVDGTNLILYYGKGDNIR
ncbi:hypothetical protein ABKN59_006300 [Abortiporus biennis]